MDTYEQLRVKLAAHPMGAPERDSILEILRILFSQDEAELALQLPFKPGRDTEIARKAGLPLEEVVARGEAMADKGLSTLTRPGDGTYTCCSPPLRVCSSFPS